MPSRSPKQARLMRAVAHGWKKPGGGGPTRKVAREFVNADRRKKVTGYQYGGPAQYRGIQGMRQKSMGPLSRDPRAMPPQPYGATTGQSSLPPQLRNRGFVQGMPPGIDRGMGGRQPPQVNRRMPIGMRDPRQRIPGPGGQGGPPGRGGMPPQQGGALRQLYNQMQGGKGGPRRMVPPSPQRGYPGGGNPNLGGRNPMMRQTSRYGGMGGRGQGPTSYLR